MSIYIKREGGGHTHGASGIRAASATQPASAQHFFTTDLQSGSSRQVVNQK
jgi:hypothetical protein